MLQQALQLGRFGFWRLCLASTLTALAVGCGSNLRERTVSDVKLLETKRSELDVDEALGGLALARPRTLFWVERERDVYDANLLARDLERIERFYRARGYYDVKVVAARVESVREHEVEIEVHVTPGPRVVVRSVRADQATLLALPGDVTFKYKKVREPELGQPFTEARLDRYKAELLEMFREAGYAYAKVRVTASVDLNAQAADVAADVQPGRRARFGAIRIVGLTQVPENKVRAALNLRPGAQYNEADQEDARQALEGMRLFTRVAVAPDLSHPELEDVPILVSLQEDQLRKLMIGGGTVLDALKFEMHARTGWENKNFLGGARKLSLVGSIGPVLFPTRLENLDSLDKPSNAFWVVHSSVRLDQPSLFNGRTAGSIEARYDRDPVLYPLEKGASARAEVVIGYNRPQATLALNRSFWGKRISLTPSYNVEARVPFFYQNPSTDSNLETVWVSYPKLTATIQSLPGDLQQLLPGDSSKQDRRDFTLSFSNSVEIAGLKLGGRRTLGGSVSDVKIEPELRAFFPAWGSKLNKQQKVGNIILASRFKVGFLFAADYGDSLRTDQTATLAPTGSAELQRLLDSDQQKLLSRAFYSGGALSNRGYAQNAISPQGPIGFLLPAGVDCAARPDAPGCSLKPLGGFTLWEASFEVRFAGLYPLTLVAFLDASDVSRDVGKLQFKYPHLSVGPGVRYESPVGPLRLDFGIRVPGWQAIGERSLPLSHGKEPADLFGVPATINLALGDAF